MSQAGKKAVKYPMPNAKKEKNPDIFYRYSYRYQKKRETR
jgi:hypothetical protein